MSISWTVVVSEGSQKSEIMLLVCKGGMPGLSSIDGASIDGITCLAGSMLPKLNLAGASPFNLLDRLGGSTPCAGFDDAFRLELVAAAEV